MADPLGAPRPLFFYWPINNLAVQASAPYLTSEDLDEYR